MIDVIKNRALEQGINLSIVPIECILDIRNNLMDLIRNNILHRRMKWIEEERYLFNNHSFQPRTIITAVWKMNLARMVLNYRGNSQSCVVSDLVYPTIEKRSKIMELFEAYGFSIEYVHWIPHKLCAVRSGLCEYGKNNIAYTDEWGSFARIEVYISDAPFEEYIWRDMLQMASCEGCNLCSRNCPTEAILSDRFVIDSKRCLYSIPYEEGDMLEWMQRPVPFRLFECLYCQDICPVNHDILANIEKIEFNEIDTGIMMSSNSYYEFPEHIKDKIWHFKSGEKYECIPRNIRRLLTGSAEKGSIPTRLA